MSVVDELDERRKSRHFDRKIPLKAPGSGFVWGNVELHRTVDFHRNDDRLQPATIQNETLPKINALSLR